MDDGQMTAESWRTTGAAIAGVLALAVVAYAPGLTIPYYGDDLQLYFPALGMDWADHFVATGPTTPFYRPLQNAVLTLVQSWVGMNTVPVHVLTLGLHLGTVAVVYEGSRWMGASRAQSVAAAGLMAVAQANAAAVLGNDTMSQVGSTLFGYLSLRCYSHVIAGGRDAESGGSEGEYGRLAYGGALAALGTALLWKESAFAFVLLLVLLEVGAAVGDVGRRASLAVRAKRLAPVLVLGAAYLLLRSAAGAMGPGFGSGPYQLAVGPNLIRNAALFAAAATSLVPTPRVALWAQTGQWVGVAAAAAGSLLLVSGVAAGVYRSGRSRVVWALIGIALASLAPVLPLNDVSELYVYTAMPPLCVVVALGVGPWMRVATGAWRVGGAGLLVAFAVAQGAAVQHKARLMATTGERTQKVLRQVVDVARTAPTEAHLCLRDASSAPAADTTAYSIYRMPGVLPLAFAEPVVRHRAHRPDLSFTTGSPSCPSGATILHLRDDGRTLVAHP